MPEETIAADPNAIAEDVHAAVEVANAPALDDAHAKMTAFKRGLDGIAGRLTGGGAYDSQNVAACVLELVKLLGGNV